MSNSSLANLGNLIKGVAAEIALPLVTSFATNVEANPTPANFAAQLVALKVELLAALPNLEQGLIKGAVTDLQNQVIPLLTTAAAKAG